MNLQCSTENLKKALKKLIVDKQQVTHKRNYSSYM